VSLLSDASGFLTDLGKAVNGLRAFENGFGQTTPAATQPTNSSPATPAPFDLKSVSPWVWVGVGGLALVLLLRR
jgi:hypothetical protein